MIRRVLVIDDDEDARMFLGRTLSDAGYAVAFASNGWEALISLDHADVDLILLDLFLPGMDGVTFLRILTRTHRQRMPHVIVVSVLSRDEVGEKLGELTVSAIVPKGQVHDLLGEVRRLLPDVSEC